MRRLLQFASYTTFDSNSLKFLGYTLEKSGSTVYLQKNYERYTDTSNDDDGVEDDGAE